MIKLIFDFIDKNRTKITAILLGVEVVFLGIFGFYYTKIQGFSSTGFIVRSFTGVVFKDSSGKEADLTQYRLLSGLFDNIEKFAKKGHVVGLRKNSNYLTVWEKIGDIVYNVNYEGYLQDKDGKDIPIDSLKFATLGDIDGDYVDDLVGVQSETNMMYIWGVFSPYNQKFTDDQGNQKYIFRPKFDGKLLDKEGKEVPVTELKAVISADWDGDKKDEIRAVRETNSWDYVWDVTTIDIHNFPLQRSNQLEDINGKPADVAGFNYVTFTANDENNSNAPLGALLIVTEKDKYSVWDKGPKPEWSNPLCNNTDKCDGKMLVFSLDQAMTNGIIMNVNPQNPNFVKAYDRVLDTLVAFNKKYDVYALLNPMVRDKSKLDYFLDKLAERKIKFIFDVIASDTTQVGGHTAKEYGDEERDLSNEVDDLAHGIAMYPPKLEKYATKYKDFFAGIRFHELYGADYIFNMCAYDHSYCRYDTSLAARDKDYPRFYDKRLVEQFVDFAKEHSMFVIVSDGWFDRYSYSVYNGQLNPIPTNLSQFEADFNDLSKKNPGMFYFDYANNEGTGRYLRRSYRLKNWQTVVSNFTSEKGFGVSNQSWLCDEEMLYNDITCPPTDMALWAADSYNKGGSIVQLEPFWYYWQWPRAEIERQQNVYDVNGKGTVSDIDWDVAGTPTDRMVYFAMAMGVYIDPSLTNNKLISFSNLNLYSIKKAGDACSLSNDQCGEGSVCRANPGESPKCNPRCIIDSPAVCTADQVVVKVESQVPGCPMLYDCMSKAKASKFSGRPSYFGAYDQVGTRFYFNSTRTTSKAEKEFPFGVIQKNFYPFLGDWDGDGIDSIALYDPQISVFFLKNANSGNATGGADKTFTYGIPGVSIVPIIGDWNGDGVDTVGVFDSERGVFYLRNTNSYGDADMIFSIMPTDHIMQPVVGDWNGNGDDTVGLYDPNDSTFYLKDKNFFGVGKINLKFKVNVTGAQGKLIAISGDWNGDGRSHVGLFDSATGTFYLKLTNTDGAPEVQFTIQTGKTNLQPIVGHWK